MIPIKKLRIERGLTQKQLADILDVDRTTIVKYETGKNGPSSEQLEKLANFFGTSTDYLLGRKSQPLPESTGGVWIPVLGRVAAGVPIQAIEEIEDYEEITKEMARKGGIFCTTCQG